MPYVLIVFISTADPLPLLFLLKVLNSHAGCYLHVLSKYTTFSHRSSITERNRVLHRACQRDAFLISGVPIGLTSHIPVRVPKRECHSNHGNPLPGFLWTSESSCLSKKGCCSPSLRQMFQCQQALFPAQP